jgi:hypothetical protein
MRDDDGQRKRCERLAERVRAALIEHAIAAHEDAGLRGLCAEGAWEAAIGALRQLDLRPTCREPDAGESVAP